MNSILKKRRFVCFLLSLLCMSSFVVAQNVIAVLYKAASIYEESNGLTVYFTMSLRSEKQQVSEGFDGVINIKGEKFVLKTPDMVVWFDGKSQWTYLEKNEEVSVTTPNEEEVMNLFTQIKDSLI